MIYTSESVTEGHPDKICDQVSDAILDELLRQDPLTRAGIETYVTSGVMLVGGEISTSGYVNVQKSRVMFYARLVILILILELMPLTLVY